MFWGLTRISNSGERPAAPTDSSTARRAGTSGSIRLAVLIEPRAQARMSGLSTVLYRPLPVPPLSAHLALHLLVARAAPRPLVRLRLHPTHPTPPAQPVRSAPHAPPSQSGPALAEPNPPDPLTEPGLSRARIAVRRGGGGGRGGGGPRRPRSGDESRRSGSRMRERGVSPALATTAPPLANDAARARAADASPQKNALNSFQPCPPPWTAMLCCATASHEPAPAQPPPPTPTQWTAIL